MLTDLLHKVTLAVLSVNHDVSESTKPCNSTADDFTKDTTAKSTAECRPDALIDRSIVVAVRVSGVHYIVIDLDCFFTKC